MEVADVPCELLTNFNPIYPLIVGALLPGEENIGFVQVIFYFGFIPCM
jgi:ribosome biogenesis protein BMS1